MSSWTNENKTAGASFSNEAKNTTTILNRAKSGQPINYDSNITYDGDNPWGGDIYYDGAGVAPTITNLTKN